MIKRSNSRYTQVCIRIYVEKWLKTKKIDIKIKIGFSWKAPLRNIVRKLHAKSNWGSSIKKLTKKRGNYGWKKKETRHPQPISANIQSPIISEVFRISTRSKRDYIRYPLLYKPSLKKLTWTKWCRKWIWKLTNYSTSGGHIYSATPLGGLFFSLP